MVANFLEILRKFDIGLVSFDEDFNIICINSFIGKEFALHEDSQLKDLLSLHKADAAGRIKKMVQEARIFGESSSYILKLVHHHKKDKILLGKIFLLTGSCPEKYLATLFDITPFASEGQPNNIVKIPVYDGQDLLFLELRKVAFFKAAGNYTEVCYNDKLYLCPLPLGRIENLLDKTHFSRVHRSYIVNINKVKKLLKTDNRYLIVLDNKQTLPIGKSRTKYFLEKFGLK
ncbi:LytR/AlgR family response regulator transcription factor [Thermosulfuriphilus sp.]